MEGPSGGSPPEYVALSPAAATEIGETVRYVRGVNRSRTPRKGKGLSAWSVGAYIARITADVGGRSNAIAGSGEGYLQNLDGVTLSDDTDTGSITIRSFFDKPLKAGTYNYAYVGWAYGEWWVVSPGSCTMVSGSAAAAQPAPATSPSPAVPPADAAAPAMMAALAAAPTPSVVPLPFKQVTILPP
jgi:hypothetical protein